MPARTQANSIIGMPVAAPSRHVENLEVLALLDNQDFPRRNSAHLLPQTGVDPVADTIRATRSMRLTTDVAAQGTGITELDQVIFEQSLRATQQEEEQNSVDDRRGANGIIEQQPCEGEAAAHVRRAGQPQVGKRQGKCGRTFGSTLLCTLD
jgi:hypothetical protein